MSATSCVPATFGDISLFGAEIHSVEANLVTNYSLSVPSMLRFSQPAIEVQNASFCNVTVNYGHPGQGDTIFVEAWLPADNWNERLQAVGGGGFVAGRFGDAYSGMAGAIGDGYATITTDAGLGSAVDATPWALLSPGNVNLYNLQNLASVSLEDEAIIGKSVIKSYYGRGPEYSYWNGCSQGGRQGIMLAQRYPTAYDGISAGAPAIYWTDIFPSLHWTQQFMNMLGEYPRPCEIQAITAAAVTACDPLDGVVDGVIGDVDKCLASFDPFKLVGQSINCTQTIDISSAAAAVVNATWQGMRDAEGAQTWFGLAPGTNLAIGVAATDCTTEPCKGFPLTIATQWLSLFVARDPSLDFSNLTHEEFDWLAHQSRQQYTSIIGTGDPDLNAFRNAGGKMVTFHGLVKIDELLPPEGTAKYFNEVSAVIPTAEDFYRHFEVPGMGHCAGRVAGEPTSLFDQLRAWVENGTAPDQTPYKVTVSESEVHNRIACPYPKKAVFDKSCGDAAEAKCWSCDN
ncbi:tannase and feruloyl esterase [Colletotrichum truncatum]|uniref:Tannase and feruloyl esterase n=1 Tax=Colletotrichum truncatum TaxID=5467 RepID=A0ACC3Z311_COLTU|nr:tannase and feruloyl esterase [Colletotrichum truncatum]KAF6793217.1 tannase and feruloyl esterase [Colletotrichum truncatum]